MSHRLNKVAFGVGLTFLAAIATSSIANEIYNAMTQNSTNSHREGFYERHVKRPQDFSCALAATICLSPVMGVTALLVRTKLGSPVIFRQERPGKNGVPFKLYKFRTMTDARDESGCLLPDEQRLTSFGKMLRSSSLDELPELVNILRGDMAVVGPRPLLMQYLPLYGNRQARRHEVCPGLTGYAQAYGRNSLTWDEKFDKDIWYVDHLSFVLDWRIIFDTVGEVLSHKGISAESSATAEVFSGNHDLCEAVQ